MQLVFIIVGGIAGLSIGTGGKGLLGLIIGAAFGYLLAQHRALRARFEILSRRVADFDSAQPIERQEPPQPAPAAAPPPLREAPPLSPAIKAAQTSESAVKHSEQATWQPAPKTLGAIEKLIALAKSWLTTGNVPVKIGVIVSFFGVGFLLKYAVEKQFFVVPIELRYLGVAVAAGILLTIGWRLRIKERIYALSLQGGGIGILYLTIFAAFRLHPLLPASIAFLLLVALTAFVGVIAVKQDAKALAVLGTVGGFLAPVLVSTGSGNHIALFGYYLLLNAAILGIAWYKVWRGLNIIGFAFTFGVGTLWGFEYYKPELLASTQPFLVAYFLFYQAIAILFAYRQPPKLRGLVDGTLIFGTPVIAFALQTQLVEGSEYGLAYSALALAVFYASVATWLHRSEGRQMRLLVESFVALGVAFATVAIPLAFDDRWTAAAWALEGAALVWVGVKQRGVLARLSGAAMLIASGAAYIRYGWTYDAGLPVLNGNFIGGMLISLASLFSARYLAADKKPLRFQSLLSVPLLIWGLAWWGGVGSMEIEDRAPHKTELDFFIAFISVSVGLLAWVGRRYDWTAARRATLAFLPILPVVAALYILEYDHLFRGPGTLIWIAAGAAHFGLLRAYDNGRGRVEGLWHFAGALLLIAAVSFEAAWRLDDAGLSDVWALSTSLLVLALASLLIIVARDRIAWPLQRYWSGYLAAAGLLVSACLLLVCTLGISSPGDPAPMPYVPIINPFDLLTIISLVIALKVMSAAKSTSDLLDYDQYRFAMTMWGLATFALSTIAVVRAVHHFGGVPWRSHTLSDSVLVQSALSIYWAILGFGGMVWGARNANRWIWLAGTGLMALVVLKLFTVDLGNTGTVARIVSFLGVGALLLVVGYFAPAPPRQAGLDGGAAKENEARAEAPSE